MVFALWLSVSAPSAQVVFRRFAIFSVFMYSVCFVALCAQVVFRRFAIFSVFMVVPSGVLKGLATKEVDLEEGDEEDREVCVCVRVCVRRHCLYVYMA